MRNLYLIALLLLATSCTEPKFADTFEGQLSSLIRHKTTEPKPDLVRADVEKFIATLPAAEQTRVAAFRACIDAGDEACARAAGEELRSPQRSNVILGFAIEAKHNNDKEWAKKRKNVIGALLLSGYFQRWPVAAEPGTGP